MKITFSSVQPTVTDGSFACPRGGRHLFKMQTARIGPNRDMYGVIFCGKCGQPMGVDNLTAHNVRGE